MALRCYSDVSSLLVHLQLIISTFRNDDGKGNDSDIATKHYYEWLKEEATIVSSKRGSDDNSSPWNQIAPTKRGFFTRFEKYLFRSAMHDVNRIPRLPSLW